MERAADAALLAEKDRLAGAVYAAGLAVEGMLRSLVWTRDKHLDERHDLRRLAVRVESLGLLRRGAADEAFVTLIQDIARGWHNNLRFAAEDQLFRWWTEVGVLSKATGRAGARQCKKFLSQCTDAIRRCETLWQRQPKSGSKRS